MPIFRVVVVWWSVFCFNELNQVAPADLEAALLIHRGESDAAVIGTPHQEKGEFPFAWVVVKPGYTVTEKDIVEFVARSKKLPP